MNLISILHGPSGKISAMRGMSIITVLTILSVWAYVSIMKLQMQTFDETTLAMFAVAFGGKLLQRGKETTT